MTADHATIDEAFHILWPVIEPHEARVSLDKAIAADKVCLWANGTKVPADWFERHLQIGAEADTTGQWTARLMPRMAIDNFYTTEWAVSRLGVAALLDNKTKPQKHAGGKPPVHNEDEIRAVAFIALARLFFKKGIGTIPEDYSGNDLAAEVRAILGDEYAPKPTRLGEIINPLLQHLKARLKR